MNEIEISLIAPCGMNCALCRAYQRNKKPCTGCKGSNETKPGYCIKCYIKNCSVIQSNASGFCYDCDSFPCKRLKQLDARYRSKYHMSMIENLEMIKENDVVSFLQHEATRWTCKECGSLICIHQATCPKCKIPYI